MDGLIVWQQKNKANCAGWVINKGRAQTSWQLLHHKISAAESVLVAFTTVLFYNIPLFPLWRLTVLSVSLCVRTCQLTFIMDVLVLIRAMLESLPEIWYIFSFLRPLWTRVTHFVGSWHRRRFEGVHLDLVKGCGVDSSPHTHRPTVSPRPPLPYWLSATLSV